jgi:hypothetical protein
MAHMALITNVQQKALRNTQDHSLRPGLKSLASLGQPILIAVRTGPNMTDAGKMFEFSSRLSLG